MSRRALIETDGAAESSLESNEVHGMRDETSKTVAQKRLRAATQGEMAKSKALKLSKGNEASSAQESDAEESERKVAWTPNTFTLRLI